jgi:CheY-like chemotaxis protein
MPAKILCVEDNERNLRLVRKFLEHAGYQVLEAMDGTSAQEIIETDTPDLILMDVNLPDMDGLEITANLKANQHFQHIPIIALTANAMHGDRERCLAAGCDGYISKPVERATLLDSIAVFFPT